MTKIGLKVIVWLFFFNYYYFFTIGIYYLSFTFVRSLKAPAYFFLGKRGVWQWLVMKLATRVTEHVAM